MRRAATVAPHVHADARADFAVRPVVRDPRLLVVDDYPAMRRVMRAVLAELGWRRVTEAADGLAALALLRGMPFDLVITDIHMPRLNGFELLAAIKADAALAHLPVLMATAEARREDIELAERRGAIGCIVKPFSAAALAARLAPVLGMAASGDREAPGSGCARAPDQPFPEGSASPRRRDRGP